MAKTVEQEFEDLVDCLTDDQWWSWVRGWIDPDLIVEIYKNWDEEVKKEEIQNLRKILKAK